MYIKTAMRSALLLVLVVEATTAAPRRPGATPPLGWSTWCTGGSCGQPVQEPAWRDDHDVCTEAEIKSIATEMQSNGMRAAGYEYIMLVRLPAPAAPPPSVRAHSAFAPLRARCSWADFHAGAAELRTTAGRRRSAVLAASSPPIDGASPPATALWRSWLAGCTRGSSCSAHTRQPATRLARAVTAASPASLAHVACPAAAPA